MTQSESHHDWFKNRARIKNFGSTRLDHLKTERLGKLCVIHVYTISPIGTRT